MVASLPRILMMHTQQDGESLPCWHMYLVDLWVLCTGELTDEE
jgi:hypothetical protein